MVFPNKDFNEVFNTLEEEMGKLGYVLPTKNMLTTGTVLVEANLNQYHAYCIDTEGNKRKI